MRSLILIFFLLWVLVLSSCNRMKGTYMGAEQSHFDKIIFTSKHTVELIFLGSIVEAEYEREGSQVKINTAMGTQVLEIDADGCLDGGFIMGKYCKD